MDDAEHPSTLEEMLGKVLLVGITYLDSSGEFVEQVQQFGRVRSAHADNGIVLDCDDGSEFSVAPMLEAIECAAPGIYTLRADGRVVIDPDYVAKFTVTRPPGRSS